MFNLSALNLRCSVFHSSVELVGCDRQAPAEGRSAATMDLQFLNESLENATIKKLLRCICTVAAPSVQPSIRFNRRFKRSIARSILTDSLTVFWGDWLDLRVRLPQVIAYTQAAMRQPNHYLWGGTIGPNYDCSGLMQAAFLSAGIWIPRDAYQQADFAQPIDLQTAEPGDLVFFGTDRITHVGLYLGDNYYIHSSGKDQGRNGIGIDRLSADDGAIAQAYYQQFHSVGRITVSYQPASQK